MVFFAKDANENQRLHMMAVMGPPPLHSQRVESSRRGGHYIRSRCTAGKGLDMMNEWI